MYSIYYVLFLHSSVFYMGCLVRSFGSKGLIKFVKVHFELFKQFDVQFRKWRILLVPEVILVQKCLNCLKYI